MPEKKNFGTIDKLSMLLNQRDDKKRNRLLSIVGSVVGSLIVLFVGWIGSQMKDNLVKLERLEVRIDTAEKRLDKVEKWEVDWVDHGLLKADVEQNEKLKEVFRRLELLEKP